jgi:histidinol phosphatase-like enzyme
MVGNSESDLKFSENCGIPYLDVREKKAITQMNYFLEN